MKQSTVDKALSALDGMREIVRAEMLVRRTYIEDEISDERRAKADAICGGRKACAIGSLWLGYGIKPQVTDRGTAFEGITLPGVGVGFRRGFVRHRPGLKLALEALNEAASKFAAKHMMYIKREFSDPIEALFEGSYGDDLTKKDLLSIIAAAKRRIKTNAK